MSSISRRSFVKRVGAGSAALGTPPLLSGCAAPGPSEPISRGEGFAMPAPEELEAIVADMGFLMTPEEVASYGTVLEGYLQGAEALDQQSNLPPVKYPNRSHAFPTDADNPLGAWYVRTEIEGSATGPLAGRTLAIKDNVMIAGVPMMNGTSVLEGYVPDIDATIVERILDAGGRIAGKSVCEAYCLAGSSLTSATGPVHNPHRRGHSAGGSSSGSGALVGSGAVDMAIGCDQGGSIRVPSAFCGVYGMKPTTGLVPYSGILGFYAPIDHTGPMTQSVADNVLLLEVLAGPDGIDPRQAGARVTRYRDALGQGVRGLRIGVLQEGFGRPELSEPEVDERVRDAAARLASLGADVREVSVPAFGPPALTVFGRFAGAMNNVFATDGFGLGQDGLHDPGFVDFHHRWREHLDEMPETVKLWMIYDEIMRARHGARLNAKGANLVRALRSTYNAALNDVDLLLMPTVPYTARELPPAGSLPAVVLQEAWDSLGNTLVFDETQHPAMSVPCGMSDGLPVGMQLVGRHWEEATIYRAAEAFEASVDWRTL